MPKALTFYVGAFFLDTALIALLVGLAFYRYKVRSFPVRLLGWILFVSFAANIIAFFILKGVARNIPGTVYDFFLVLLVSVFYNHQTKGRRKTFFIVVCLIFLVAGIYNLSYLQQLTITSHNKLFSSIIIICYAVMFFYQLMKDLPERQVHHLPMFWFNSAFLVYHAGTIFLFAFTSYLINVLKNDLLYYMMFHNVLSIIQHCIFLVGLRYDLKRLQSGVKGFTGQLSRN